MRASKHDDNPVAMRADRPTEQLPLVARIVTRWVWSAVWTFLGIDECSIRHGSEVPVGMP